MVFFYLSNYFEALAVGSCGGAGEAADDDCQSFDGTVIFSCPRSSSVYFARSLFYRGVAGTYEGVTVDQL